MAYNYGIVLNIQIDQRCENIPLRSACDFHSDLRMSGIYNIGEVCSGYILYYHQDVNEETIAGQWLPHETTFA